MTVKRVNGVVTLLEEDLSALTGGVSRSELTTESAAAYAIALEQGRVHDAVGTLLDAAASDDMGVIGGTFGTDAVKLNTIDQKTATASAYARYRIQVPHEYVAAGNITVRLNAGMTTTISDGTATIDVECYRAAAPTVDLCATAAQSINSLTPANKDFTLTGTTIVPGDVLDLRVAIAISDTATVGAVIGTLYGMTLLMGVKG